MELEYKIVHSYIDKFSRPFERNQLRLEEFNRQLGKTVSLFDQLRLGKDLSLSFNSRPILQEVDAVKRKIGGIRTLQIDGEKKLPRLDVEPQEISLNWKNHFSVPKFESLESKIVWKNESKFPEVPEVSGTVNWQGKVKEPHLKALKLEVDYDEALRTSKRFSTKLNRTFRNALRIEPDLKARNLFKNTRITLRKLDREFKRYEPVVTPKIDESLIHRQLEEIRKDIAAQSFVSSISVGFGLNQLKDQLKEEGLSLSEALYESTKYGLRKSRLAYEIAQEVNKTGGYIDATEIGNNIVTALRLGVRGSEKELAHFGTLMTKFQKAFDVPAEEIGRIIYSLQRFHIPTEEFDRILGKAVALRKEFNITSDTMKEIMSDIDQNFGFVMNELDKASRSKFIVGMEELASALENSYIDSTKFMQMLAGALSGNAEDLQKAYYLTGLNLEQLRKIVESGDIRKLGESFIKQAQKLYRQYGNLTPTQQAVIAENLGIDPKDFQQILQIGKNAESFRETLKRAFEIKPESPDKVIKESTNTLTRYMNIIKNKIIGFGGNLGEEAVDTVSSLFDLISSPLGAVATAWLGQKFGKRALSWVGEKLLGSLSKRVSAELFKDAGKVAATELSSVGVQAGKGLLSGVLGGIRSAGSFLLSKLSIPITIASVVLEPEEVNVSEEELLAQWRKSHQLLTPDLKVKPRYSLDEVLKRQVQVESSGNPFAVSKVGAVGLAQFMPETWKDVWSRRRRLFEKYNPELSQFKGIPDIYDPKAQLAAQKAYMSYLIDKFKDIRWALAAYNAGEGRIQKLYSQFGGNFLKAFAFLPEETQNYIKKILSTPKAKPITVVPEPKQLTFEKPSDKAVAQESNLEKGKEQKKENCSEVTLLKEISNHLQSIQALLFQAYQQKLLTPEGLNLPSVDPFELWRKN